MNMQSIMAQAQKMQKEIMNKKNEINKMEFTEKNEFAEIVVFGNKKYYNSLERFCKQAKNVGIFYNIYAVDEMVLKNDTLFYVENEYILNSDIEGYGGWIWKPYIIESAFKKFPDSDFFLYIDCGAEININYKTIKRFHEYIEIANNDNVLAFRNREEERRLAHCSVIDNIFPEGRDSKQFEANFILLKNNSFSLEIIKEWKHECRNNNYYNILTFDKGQCCDLFGFHLHDQPVLSLLLKKININGIPDEAGWYFPSQTISINARDNIKKYPFFMARNPFGYSVLGKCVAYKTANKSAVNRQGSEFKVCMNGIPEKCNNFIRVR